MIDPRLAEIPETAIKALPESVVRECCVLPFRVEARCIWYIHCLAAIGSVIWACYDVARPLHWMRSSDAGYVATLFLMFLLIATSVVLPPVMVGVVFKLHLPWVRAALLILASILLSALQGASVITLFHTLLVV